MKAHTASFLCYLGLVFFTTPTHASPTSPLRRQRDQHSKIIPPDACETSPQGVAFCTDDCTAVIECLGDVPVTIADCAAASLYCYASATVPSACAPISQCGGPIICEEVGQFPDPDICTKHHDCAEPFSRSVVADCADDSAYNIATNECDLSLDATVCGPDGPVPACLFFGQSGALADNPSYYYKCLRVEDIVYPGLYYCGEDGVYSGASRQCEYPTLTTEEPHTTAELASTTTTQYPTTGSTLPPTETAPTAGTTRPPTETTTRPPMETTTRPPTETTERPPTETTPRPPTETTERPPTETTPRPPTETTERPPTETTSGPPIETTQGPPTETTSGQPPIETTPRPPTEGTARPPTERP